MADRIVPHFHNDAGVDSIAIGAREFMCIGALPPFDHPHIFIDMGDGGRGDLLLLLDRLPLRSGPQADRDQAARLSLPAGSRLKPECASRSPAAALPA